MQEIAYNPARDIVYLYSAIVERAEQALYNEAYKPLHWFMSQEGVDDTDVAEGLKRFCQVLNEAHKNPDESLWDVMERCQFNDVAKPVKIAIMYYIGTMCAGTWFQGLRDVVALGDDTLPEIQRLMDTAEEFTAYTTMGPWRRRWERLKRRCLPKRYKNTIGGVHVKS
jgi:hypothetical protein